MGQILSWKAGWATQQWEDTTCREEFLLASWFIFMPLKPLEPLNVDRGKNKIISTYIIPFNVQGNYEHGIWVLSPPSQPENSCWSTWWCCYHPREGPQTTLMGFISMRWLRASHLWVTVRAKCSGYKRDTKARNLAKAEGHWDTQDNPVAGQPFPQVQGNSSLLDISQPGRVFKHLQHGGDDLRARFCSLSSTSASNMKLQWAQQDCERVQGYPTQSDHTPRAGLPYSTQTIYSCFPWLMKANSSLIKAN